MSLVGPLNTNIWVFTRVWISAFRYFVERRTGWRAKTTSNRSRVWTTAAIGFHIPTRVYTMQRFFDMHSPRDGREHYQRENIFFWLFLHLSRRLLRRKVHVWWFEVKEKEREKCKLREYCRWDKSKNRVKVQRSQLYSKRERDIFDTYQPITKNIVSISDNCEYLQSKEWVMKIES